MQRFFESILKEKGVTLFFIPVIFYWLTTFLTNEFVITDNLLYNSFHGLIPDGFIEKAISIQHKWIWVGYVILPLVLLIKYLFVSAFITTGAIFKDVSINFKNTFKVVMIGEWLFVIVGIINLFVLLFSSIQNISDIQNLDISTYLSVGTAISGIKSIHWLATPLKTINVSQLIYALLLIFGIKVLTQKSTKKLTWVIASYGSLLLIWTLLLTYINVSYA